MPLSSLNLVNTIAVISLTCVAAATLCATRILISSRSNKSTINPDRYVYIDQRTLEGDLYEDGDGISSKDSEAAFYNGTTTMKMTVVVPAIIAAVAAISGCVQSNLEANRRDLVAQYAFTFAWTLVAFQSIDSALASASQVPPSSCFSDLDWQPFALIDENASREGLVGVSSLPGLIHTVAGAVTMATAFLLRRRPDVYSDGEVVDAQYTVSALSRYTFAWLWPILSKARLLQRLELPDLPHLDHSTTTNNLQKRFGSPSSSRGHNQSLWWRLFRDHRHTILRQWALVSVESLALVVPQIALFNLLALVEKRQRIDVANTELWFWVAALAVSKFALVYLENWRMWVSFGLLATQVRSQLFALIFIKSMHSKEIAAIKTTQNARDRETRKILKEDAEEEGESDGLLAGEVQQRVEDYHIRFEDAGDETDDDAEAAPLAQTAVNLLGVDVARVTTFCGWNPDLLGSLLKLIVAVWFLIRLIGWQSTIAGLAVPVTIQPINTWVSRYYYAGQEAVMMARDDRTHTVTEALHGIRQIKFSALEQQWQQTIMNLRDRELYQQKWVFVFGTTLTFLWLFLPILLGTVALGVYAWLNGTMTASIAFTALSVFQSLEWTLGVIPNTITELFDAKVSVARIQEYLDISDKEVSTLPGKSIKFENATISWPSNGDRGDDDFSVTALNLEFPNQELSVIHGKAGSGKSLMLAAIIGEADVKAGVIYVPRGPQLLERDNNRVTVGNWIVPSALAFVSQIPWLEHASVKENILFGLPLVSNRYAKALYSCALIDDLAMLPDGDETEVGPSGINLSGGQKWRITFARALYSRAGILVMDDIFSAVDTHVGRHLLENALAGELGDGRTRILVTHHIDLVRDIASYIVELEENGRIKSAISNYVHPILDAGGSLESTSSAESTIPKSSLLGADSTHTGTRAKPNPKKFVEDETRETGRVRWNVYKMYVSASGTTWYFGIAIIIYVLAALTVLGRSYWVRIWTEDREGASMPAALTTSPQQSIPKPTDNLVFYLSIYLGLSLAVAIFVCGKVAMVCLAALRASRKLFEDMTFTVLRAPLRWLDTVPTGRVLNRFVSDFALIDSRLGGDFNWFMTHLLDVVMSVAAALFVSPSAIVLVALLAIMSLYYMAMYLVGARDLKRLESISKSPVFELMGATLAGLSTVRSFDKVEVYLQRMFRLVDNYARTTWYLELMSRWMSFRQGVLGTAFSVSIAALVVSVPGIDASLAGFALAFALQYSTVIVEVVTRYAALELDINSAERAIEYIEMPMEEQLGNEVHADWPSDGRIVVEDLEASYAPDLPPVLSDLNFEVRPRQRVGIVGRTGSGKSSLILALFRLLDLRRGRVFIDGMDISSIKLRDLRSRVAMVPQDPVLFSGTLRSNLDPFNEHSDATLHEALRRVHLANIAVSDNSGTRDSNIRPSLSQTPAATNAFDNLQTPVSRGGLNLSQGQRQLVCLARAIVARPKILILDEATSAVDMVTDALIQRSIRKEFASSTLLVVAHRLSTISDFDKVLVLRDGRVVEYGGPKELWKEMSTFREMVDRSGERALLEKMLRD